MKIVLLECVDNVKKVVDVGGRRKAGSTEISGN